MILYEVNALNRIKFVPVMMAIAIAAMMATIPVITMPQIAKADIDCSADLSHTSGWYNSDYNHGYTDAQRDWNLQRFTVQSGGDNSCPNAEGHTFEYCDGYQNGYTVSWNAWTYDMQHGLYPFVYLSQQQNKVNRHSSHALL